MEAVLIILYLVPGLVASLRGHHNELAIWLLNIFLGWTFVGWVGALVWAATSVRDDLKKKGKKTQS